MISRNGHYLHHKVLYTVNLTIYISKAIEMKRHYRMKKEAHKIASVGKYAKYETL